MGSPSHPSSGQIPFYRNTFDITHSNMIKSIFYCKFDIHKGPVVHHQVPLHSITSSPLSSTPPLFDFHSYAPYLIPRQSFCSLSLTFCTPTHRVLSHPICISSSHYPRNEFLFTFALALSLSTPAHPYVPIVKKLSTLCSILEQQSRFLSADTSTPNTGPVFAICEILREDLNIYSECMIPVDDSNSLNIKLFPTYPSPRPILPHHVPLSTVQLGSLTDHNWDLTMLLILPYIDGVNSVKRIAQLADADYKLVCIALAHLLYYGCITLHDVFHFGASYAVTAELGSFVSDAVAQEECRRYIAIPDTELPRNFNNQADPEVRGAAIGGTKLVELYTSFKQGQILRTWCLEHERALAGLDIRRFVTFGVIKGFLYRVSKYAILVPGSSDSWKKLKEMSADQSGGHFERTPLPEELVDSHIGQGKYNQRPEQGSVNNIGKPREENEKTNVREKDAGSSHELLRYVNGLHSFDEICTRLEIGENTLMRKLRDTKDLQIVQR